MNEISEIRRNGVLTSGEDCAVLNAAIRAVVYRVSFGYGREIVGIIIGTLGLLSGPIAARPLGPSDLDGRLNRESGTFLGNTNKGNPFASKMPDGAFATGSWRQHLVHGPSICWPKANGIAWLLGGTGR